MFNLSNWIWRKFWKKTKITTTAFVLLSQLLVQWCWSWGWGKSNSSLNSNREITLSLLVQAWYVANSEVEIKTLEWKVLYFWITDSSWKLQIDNNELKTILQENWLTEESKLIVEANYWIDIDPDDDWNIENDVDELVNWAMKWILSFNELNKAIITPISTKVVEILIWVYWENLDNLRDNFWKIDEEKTWKKIQKIIQELWIKDINWDWILTNEDVINYNMVKHNSELEELLKTNGYLWTIHSWDEEEKNRIIEEERIKLNLVLTEVVKEEDKYYVKLTKSAVDWTLEYSYNLDQWHRYYEWDKIELDQFDLIYYREGFNSTHLYWKTTFFQLTQDEIDKFWTTNNWWWVESWGDTWWWNNSWETWNENDIWEIENIIIWDINTWIKENWIIQKLTPWVLINPIIEYKTDEKIEISYWINQEEVDNLRTELIGIESYISNVSSQILTNSTNLNNLQNQLSSVQSWAVSAYTSSDYSSKVLVDTQLSSSQKKVELNNNLNWTYLRAYKWSFSSLEDWMIFLSGIWWSIISEWNQITSEMISNLESQIYDEERALRDKKNQLNVLENELSDFKKDFADEINSYNQALSDKNSLINTLDNSGARQLLLLDFKSIINRYWIQRALDSLESQMNFYSMPNKYDYPLDTTTNNFPDSMIFNETLFSNFYWSTVTSYTTYKYPLNYPSSIYFKIGSGKTATVLTRNAEHNTDLKNHIRFQTAWTLVKKELENIEAAELTVEVNRMIIEILADIMLDLDNFEDEYYSLKNDIDSITAKLKSDKIKLNNYKTQINNLWNKLKDIYSQEKLIDNQDSQIIQLNWEFDNLNKDKDKKIIEINLAESWSEYEVIKIYISKAEQEIVIWTKKFTMIVWATFDDNKTEEQLQQELEQRITKLQNTHHFENFEYNGEIVSLTNRVIYYINWETKYPALMWWEYSAFWIQRESKVYTINESYAWEGDAVKEDIWKQLENNILNIWTYDNYEVLLPNELDWLAEYKWVVHYNYNNNWAYYSAKVWIHYRIWNQEYYKYSDVLARNETEKNQIATNLIQYLRDNIKQDSYSATEVNAWETIWWNWEYIEMIWWAYNIYQVPDWYIATYKVANLGEWHISTVWNDVNSLQDEVLRIMDDWVEKNSTVPVDWIMKDREANEIFYTQLNNGNLDDLFNQYNSIYTQLEQSCAETAYNNFPLTWENSLIWNWNSQIEFIQECIEREKYKQNLRKKFKDIIEIELPILTTNINVAEWFWKWYWQAIMDTATFISSLSIDELKNIKDNLIDSWIRWRDYIANIWAYWKASINYWQTWNQDSLTVKNQLAQSISLSSEIVTIENIIKDIDWDDIEDADYWTWYISWYLAENMVVWYSINKWVKWTYKYWLNKLTLKINKLRKASKTVKAFRTVDNVDGIIEVANIQKLSITDPKKISILVSWWIKSSGEILDSLISKWWKFSERITTNKWLIYVYKSPNWGQKINYRNFDSSEWLWLYEWYNHNMTMDLMKINNSWRYDVIKEIKFLNLKK